MFKGKARADLKAQHFQLYVRRAVGQGPHYPALRRLATQPLSIRCNFETAFSDIACPHPQVSVAVYKGCCGKFAKQARPADKLCFTGIDVLHERDYHFHIIMNV